MLKEELRLAGYISDPSDSPQTICFNYFNVQKRMVSQKPREVIISKGFSCPTGINDALCDFKNKVITGENLNIHVSKMLLKADYNDQLLNDWGIHHFHLGTGTNSNGFVARNNSLLYAMVKDNAVYFLTILNHGNWTNLQLLEIIHSNWPEVIRMYKNKGAINVGENVSENELKVLRRKGVVTVLKLKDGSEYFPIGKGYMSSGISTEVVMTADKYTNYIREREQYIRDNADMIINAIEENWSIRPSKLDLHIAIKGDVIYVVETNFKICCKIGGLN